MRGERSGGQPGGAPALTPPPLGRASCLQLTPRVAAMLSTDAFIKSYRASES